MTISNPHDRYFREIFSDPVVVQDLLRNYLPAPAVESLDLTTLVLQKESFIDEELRQHFTDLLYSVQQQNGAPAQVYILFEHKSYADRLTSFQLLRYLVRIWERMLRQSEPLSPIISLVFYHGVEKWDVPRTFADLLPAAEGLAAYAPHFHYELLDLSAIPEQQIKGEVLLLGLLTKMHVQSCVKCGATRGEPDGKRTKEELTGSWGGFEFHLKPRVNSFLWPVSYSVPLVETSVA